MPLKISELSIEDLDRTVTWSNGYKTESGVITSYNDTYVFVRFSTSNFQSQACRPEDLNFEFHNNRI